MWSNVVFRRNLPANYYRVTLIVQRHTRLKYLQDMATRPAMIQLNTSFNFKKTDRMTEAKDNILFMNLTHDFITF